MAVAKPLDTLDVCGSEALVVCSCVVFLFPHSTLLVVFAGWSMFSSGI